MIIFLLLLFIIALPTILNLMGLGFIFSYMVKFREVILIIVIGIITYPIYNIYTGKTTVKEALFNTFECIQKILACIGILLAILLVFYILKALFLF